MQALVRVRQTESDVQTAQDSGERSDAGQLEARTASQDVGHKYGFLYGGRDPGELLRIRDELGWMRTATPCPAAGGLRPPPYRRPEPAQTPAAPSAARRWFSSQAS